MTVNRFCSSGLQTIALAAQRIIAGEGEIFVAGGVESISLVQNEMNKHHFQDEWLHRHKPEIYWPMLQTAEYVARALRDHARAAGPVRRAEPAARGEGARRGQVQGRDRADHHQDEGGRQGRPARSRCSEVTASEDEGIRADTTYEGVSQIKPAIEGGVHRRRQRQPVLRRRLGRASS